MMAKRDYFIDVVWWGFVPLLAFGVQILIETHAPRDILGALHSESGPHEMLQFLVISFAFLVAITTLPNINFSRDKFLAFWVSLAALSCLYVAGEEISWGQHVFDWTTSEYWHGVNDQGETNLHNTSSWLDQKPRLLLLIGIITGGLIIPALKQWAPHKLPQKFWLIYPPRCLVLVALFVVVPQIIEKAGELYDYHPFTRVSEVQELYMFYFVLLYLSALKSRIVQQKA